MRSSRMFDYGIIGNCLTCALVSKDASVDWLCHPTFAAPSVFARLLDRTRGGSWGIVPRGRFKISQQYLPRTAILETRFESSSSSAFTVYDFFPRYRALFAHDNKGLFARNALVRIIKPLKGAPAIAVRFDPRPDYAASPPGCEIVDGHIVCGGGRFRLASNVPAARLFAAEEFPLDGIKFFACGAADGAPIQGPKECLRLFRATKRYWEDWCATLTLPQAHQEPIIRSAITLKLLTYTPTGAIIAASTTSLPEQVGSARMFDYRFCWVRDAVMTADALKKIGRDHESKRLIEFLMRRALEDDHIQVMYGIEGETELDERALPHLAGFRGSRLVRVGNAAYLQEQHDIYGALLDLLYLYFVYYRFEPRMTKKEWMFVRRLVNHIRFHWQKKDSGIWEFRTDEKHYTYSKFMCFVGVDRAIRIAQHFQQLSVVAPWSELRGKIQEDIFTHGFHARAGAFTMAYGSTALDASLLQMAYHDFLPPTDGRLLATVHAVYARLRDDFLVSRYRVADDFGLPRSAFLACSFWLVDALVYIGETEKAHAIYEKLLGAANHLGLYPEDIDRKTGVHTGNFPQAYTHTALINSSILLSEWAEKRRRIEITPRRKRIR